ncbi:hypothetical protein JCM18382A_06460 [Bradyrhizobium sp. 17-4]
MAVTQRANVSVPVNRSNKTNRSESGLLFFCLRGKLGSFAAKSFYICDFLAHLLELASKSATPIFKFAKIGFRLLY